MSNTIRFACHVCLEVSQTDTIFAYEHPLDEPMLWCGPCADAERDDPEVGPYLRQLTIAEALAWKGEDDSDEDRDDR